jgi:uncharacterized protein YggT (Ycf19 family)
MTLSLGGLLGSLVNFYELLIIVYVVLSWFPADGVVGDIRNTLATLVEPFLGLFRRIIPPIGMVDISPFFAIIVLILLSTFVLGRLM